MDKRIRSKATSLKISLYRKRPNRASLVFRRNKILYRITTISNTDQLIEELAKIETLQNGIIAQLFNPRFRHWVLEMGTNTESNGLLNVWELANSEMKLCFKWSGTALELQNALLLFNKQTRP